MVGKGEFPFSRVSDPVETLQGPSCSLMLACRETKVPRKQGTFIPKAIGLLSGESGAFIHPAQFLPASSRDFHILGDNRVNRHRTVHAAHPILQKEGQTVENRLMGIREPSPPSAKEHFTVHHGSQLHKTWFLSVQQRQAGKEGKYCLLRIMASHCIETLLWCDHQFSPGR